MSVPFSAHPRQHIVIFSTLESFWRFPCSKPISCFTYWNKTQKSSARLASYLIIWLSGSPLLFSPFALWALFFLLFKHVEHRVLHTGCCLRLEHSFLSFRSHLRCQPLKVAFPPPQLRLTFPHTHICPQHFLPASFILITMNPRGQGFVCQVPAGSLAPSGYLDAHCRNEMDLCFSPSSRLPEEAHNCLPPILHLFPPHLSPKERGRSQTGSGLFVHGGNWQRINRKR